MTGSTRKMVCVALAVALLASGCGWVHEHRKTAIGAGAGAVGGAIIGGLAGDEETALVGAVAGALAGGAIGAYLDRKDKSAEETYEDYSYSPEQGVQLADASAEARPATVAPGGEVRLVGHYALLTPDPDRSVTVAENRVVKIGQKTVAEKLNEESRTPGTYTSEVALELPPDAAPGTYRYELRLQAGRRTYTTATDFTVR